MTKTDLTIRELRQRFADKSLSPLEYWLSLEDHIAAWEPSISALYLYDPESARAQAKASTERWAKGETLGALDGIPVTLKELIATKGQPRRSARGQWNSSRQRPTHRPPPGCGKTAR
jgi:aspartyl-tRNA(Asn)/glutamyl-tRNA(Gln) amidotransferase subunit A